MVLLGSNNPLVNVVFAPLIEVKDQLGREIDRVCPVSEEVDVIVTAIQDQSVSDPHRVHQCLPKSLDSLILCNLPHGDTQLEFV